MKINIFRAIPLLFLTIVIYEFSEKIIGGYARESWQITEWLINYQGGFVRRGFSGEIILFLNEYFLISPYYLIISLCISSYLIFMYLICKYFAKNNYSFWSLPILYICWGPFVNDFIIRKDIFLLLILTLSMLLSTKPSIKNILYVNLLMIAGIFTHESIGFIGLPILYLILLARYDKFSSRIFSAHKMAFLYLTPSFLAFLSVLYYKGSHEISNKIWGSWAGISFPILNVNQHEPIAAIDGISWTLEKGLSLTKSMLFNFDGGIYAPLAWILIIISVYYVISNIESLRKNKLSTHVNDEKHNVNKTEISNILLLQLISAGPLFILGWDYGRWVFVWAASSLLAFFILKEENVYVKMPGFINIATDTFKKITYTSLQTSRLLIVFLSLFIGVPNYSWDWVRYIDRTPIYIILKFLSENIELLISNYFM